MAACSHVSLQHQLPLNNRNNSIWTSFWSKTKVAIFDGSWHRKAPLWWVLCCWADPIAATSPKIGTANSRGSGAKKYKANFDIQTAAHKFLIGQKVWLNDTKSISKNAKLSPNWIGPFKIIDINDNNAKLKLKNNNVKFVNIAWIKDYVEEGTKTSPE